MCCFEVLLCGSEELGNLLLHKYFVGFGYFASICSCKKNFVLLYKPVAFSGPCDVSVLETNLFPRILTAII